MEAKGGLLRQLEKAAETVKQWPDWKRKQLGWDDDSMRRPKRKEESEKKPKVGS